MEGRLRPIFKPALTFTLLVAKKFRVLASAGSCAGMSTISAAASGSKARAAGARWAVRSNASRKAALIVVDLWLHLYSLLLLLQRCSLSPFGRSHQGKGGIRTFPLGAGTRRTQPADGWHAMQTEWTGAMRLPWMSDRDDEGRGARRTGPQWGTVGPAAATVQCPVQCCVVDLLGSS